MPGKGWWWLLAASIKSPWIVLQKEREGPQNPDLFYSWCIYVDNNKYLDVFDVILCEYFLKAQ